MSNTPHPISNWLETFPLIHTPFVICMAGVMFWLVILWAFNRDHWIKEGKKPAHELKDEFWVMFMGVMLGVIWDTQALYLYDIVAETIFNREVDTPTEILPEMYLVMGPAIERVYYVGKKINEKLSKKG